MTKKQKTFADEFLSCGDASAAAKKAGYSERLVRHPEPLLDKPEIRSYLDQKNDENRAADPDRIADILYEPLPEKIADSDEILEFLTHVMRGDYSEPVVLRQGGDQVLTDTPLSVRDRMRAAELIGKRFSLFSDKDISDGGAVIISGGENIED